ncbi:MAG: hypothetical protein WCR52_18940 [Bacteroidota bacterium]
MQKLLILIATSLTAIAFYACGAADTTTAVQLELRPMIKRHCVNDNQCAQFQIYFPQFSGGDSITMLQVSSTIQGYIMSMVGANSSLPFEVAIDSAGAVYCNNFLNEKRRNLNMMDSYVMNLSSSVLVNNPKTITVEMTMVNSLGNQPSQVASIRSTFALQERGRLMRLKDLVNPADSTEVTNLLEKAYKQSKGKPESARIADLLYGGMTKLPISERVCVVPEGIRFFYPKGDVAPEQFGDTDLVLTWEQLGKSADKKRWF